MKESVLGVVSSIKNICIRLLHMFVFFTQSLSQRQTRFHIQPRLWNIVVEKNTLSIHMFIQEHVRVCVRPGLNGMLYSDRRIFFIFKGTRACDSIFSQRVKWLGVLWTKWSSRYKNWPVFNDHSSPLRFKLCKTHTKHSHAHTLLTHTYHTNVTHTMFLMPLAVGRFSRTFFHVHFTRSPRRATWLSNGCEIC